MGENVRQDDGSGMPVSAKPAPGAAAPAKRAAGAPAPAAGASPRHTAPVVQVVSEPRAAQWVALTPSSAKRTTIMVLVAIVVLWVAVWAFQAVGTFLFILLLAWLLSIAMEPPVLWMVRRGVRRGLATGIVLIVGILLALGLVALFGQLFISQLAALGTQLPSAATAAVSWVNSTFHTTFDVSTLQASLLLTPDKFGQLAGTYGGGILGVFGSLVAVVFDGLTILVFAYYLSADSPRLRQTIGSWLPPSYQRYFVTIWEISVQKTGGYVVSKVLLAGMSAFFHAVFFAIIGVQYWLPLGVLAGIVGQFIPTIGTYIGVALPALFALIDKPINAVWIAAFATVYQQVENYIFTPRISQRTMDVHPAVALASVIVGAALFGPVGALIGIPLAAAALAIIQTFSRRHQLLPELASLEDAENRQEDDAKATLEHHSRARAEEASSEA